MNADVRRLADIRQQKARVRPAQPAQLNGAHGESAQVSEERLDTSEGEKDAAEHLPALGLVLDEELDRVGRVEGLEDAVVEIDEVVDAEPGVEGQPNDDDRREGRREARQAQGLDQEQDYDDAARRPHDRRARDVWADDIETLDCTEDGLRWCQDAVGEDHGHGQDADRLEQAAEESAPFQEGAHAQVSWPQVSGLVPFHVHQWLFPRVTSCDVGLSWIHQLERL